jgi:demethylmenaquinone methyltransferase/2-methoxy-6-polyprenyl-1,4-benzoquinol methylase
MVERKVLDSMLEYYRDRVPYHDECMSYMDNETMEELLGPIIEMIEDEIQDKRVLELGCGTGNWTIMLAKRALQVLATDQQEAYFEEARKKVGGLENVELRVADACELDGIEEGFDVAFAADMWSHIPRSRIPDLVANLHKRIVPGGKVVVLDFLKAEVFEQWFDHYDDDGNEVQTRTLPNGKEYLVIKNFPTMEQLMGDLGPKASGIKYIEHEGLKRWLLVYTVK